MKNYEQEIEELKDKFISLLEWEFGLSNKSHVLWNNDLIILKQKAKELKAEIENNLKFHRGLVCCPETCFCWDLEEQIEKLNKIIGSEE